MKIVVLGGCGAMGRITVRDLVDFFPEARTVVADYDVEKARALAKSMGCQAAFVDVTDPKSLDGVLKGAFVVLNSAPYQWNLEIMRGALRARCHYVDLGGLFHMTRKQMELDGEFRKIGKLALLGMGAAPGISNLLAVKAAEGLDRVDEIHIRLGSRDRSRYRDSPALPVSYSLKTILEEFSMRPAVYRRGKFTFVEPLSGEENVDFRKPVGVRRPFHTLHSEVATLPLSFKKRGVRDVTFKIAFDEDFVDRVRFLRDMGFDSHEPVGIGPVRVAPIDVVNRVAMAQKPATRVGPLKQHEVVRAVVKGRRGKKSVTVTADCSTSGMPRWDLGTDINTGCPPAIAARLLADGLITAVGAEPPEKAVPADAFFKELAKRRMRVRVLE